jgi:integrase
MAKRKTIKDKSPVKLRQRKISNGNASLYLDIYEGGVRRKECLKLYLVPERSESAKEQNQKTLKVAETIMAERLLNIQSKKSNVLQQENKLLQLPFTEYIEKEIEKLKEIRTQDYIRRYTSSVRWIKRFDSKTTLGNINKGWIQRYIHFLTVTPGKYGRRLNQNTIHEYLIYVANILNNAVREGLIQNNPTKELSIADRPKKNESRRDYLTIDEIKKLINIPSPKKYNNLRNAFLFSCFCGLRYSDIEQLKWGDIKEKDGEYCIEKKIQKTKEDLYLPLSKTALGFLPERKEKNKLVFDLPKSMTSVEEYIKVWTEFAEIDKHVTFHTARHTFAVSILTCGGDIYTLSKLLGHKNVTTTQIYADILEKTKKNTVDLLDNISL